VKKLRKLTAALLAIALVAGAAGCNTIKGAGRDIESAGEAISDTAEDVQK